MPLTCVSIRQARRVTFSDGPLTSFLSSLAAAAGAGLVLAGVLVGVLGSMRSWEREKLEFCVRRAGYLGGAVGLLALAFDQIVW